MELFHLSEAKQQRPLESNTDQGCALYNKLAKARKTCKSPGTLGLKKFGPGKLWEKNTAKLYGDALVLTAVFIDSLN